VLSPPRVLNTRTARHGSSCGCSAQRFSPRLHDEEEDDEGAEQHEAEVRNQVQTVCARRRLRRTPPWRSGSRWAAGDEDGPKIEPSTEPSPPMMIWPGSRWRRRSGTARSWRCEEVRVEHAGDAGVERRDREGQQLVAEDVDADDLGRDVLVADAMKARPTRVRIRFIVPTMRARRRTAAEEL